MTTELKGHYPAGELADYVLDLKMAIAPTLTTDLAIRWHDQNDSRKFIMQEIVEKIDGTEPRSDMIRSVPVARRKFGEIITDWVEVELTKLLPPLLSGDNGHSLLDLLHQLADQLGVTIIQAADVRGHWIFNDSDNPQAIDTFTALRDGGYCSTVLDLQEQLLYLRSLQSSYDNTTN